tara:strand:- start:8957 stop:10711 length:1755 start_codon:yes stop_codon:yes gene_type:complete
MITIGWLRLLRASVFFLCVLAVSSAQAFSVHYRDLSELNKTEWQNGDAVPSPGSEQALNGGRFIIALPSFPDNLRRIGPQTSGRFTATLHNLQLPLVAHIPATHKHPTRWLPMLASQWALSTDKKLLLFRLREDAAWSDGVAVDSEDFAFSGLFITSDTTAAEWQKRQLERLTDGINIYSDKVFAFRIRGKADEALKVLSGFRPFARHVYENRRNWPEAFNWYPEPTTGPYYLAQVRAGESLMFRRLSDWWGDQLPYFKHRFNADQVVFRTMQIHESELQLFTLGELSAIEYRDADYWQSGVVRTAISGKRISLVRLLTSASSQQPPSGLLINPRMQTINNSHERAWLLNQLNIQYIIENDYTPPLQQQSGLLADHAAYAQAQQAPVTPKLTPANITLSYTDDRDRAFLDKLKQSAADHHINLQLKKLSPAALSDKLALAEYELVWLRLNAPLSNEGLVSLFNKTRGQVFIGGIPKAGIEADPDNPADSARRIEQYLLEENLYTPGPAMHYTQAAYWQWLHLPAQGAPYYAEKLFDPFSPLYGGLFWINKKQRADILAKPQNGHKKIRVEVINPDQPHSQDSEQ